MAVRSRSFTAGLVEQKTSSRVPSKAAGRDPRGPPRQTSAAGASAFAALSFHSCPASIGSSQIRSTPSVLAQIAWRPSGRNAPRVGETPS
jgi:hypothetical protein